MTTKTQRIEIFRAGHHVDAAGIARSFDAPALQASAAAYDPAVHEAPVCIGHPKDNLPAYGWVKGLEFADGVLSAEEHQVEPAFAEMRAAGRFKKRSASFYAPDAPNNPKPGTWYLRHVAWLGAQPPAVKGLRDAAFADAEEGVVEFGDWEDRSIAALFRRLREWLIGSSGIEVADRVLPDYEIKSIEEAAMAPPPTSAPSTALYSEGDAVSTTAEQLAAQKAELDAREAKIAAREVADAAAAAASRRKGIADFCDGLVKSGQLKPADRHTVLESLCALPQATVIEFGEGDAKTEKPALQVMQDWLKTLPKAIDFTERAKTGAGELADADDLDSNEVAQRANAFKAKREQAGSHISFTEAVDAVRAGKDKEGV